MTPFLVPGRLMRHAAILACSVLLAVAVAAPPALAASGPFVDFKGAWSGTGKVRTETKTERIRCDAKYRVSDSRGHAVNLELTCKSDSYSFDLVGDFRANASGAISGRWTERSRGIGGTVIGQGRGDYIQILVESSAFAAKLVMVTRGSRQSVSIDSHGGGRVVKASIGLHRR
ncbi:MAG: hypothetical protein P8Z80_07755 [Pseudolabrys sp.]|jgi:hypothetical protein